MRSSSAVGAAFARGALLACLALFLCGCFDMEYQLSLRNDGGGAVRMQVVTDPALAGAFQGKSFSPGWTVRNFVREGRFYHEESQGFASVSALALQDESVRLQMSGLGAARQGTLEHQVRLGPADPGAAALLTGRTLTYHIQLPGPVTTVEPVFIGGIEIEPVRQPAGATWQIPLPMFLRAGGQVVRFRAHFSAAGLALADGQSRSVSSTGAPPTPSPGPTGDQALTLKALAGQWNGAALSGAAFSWNIREDGTFDSVAASGRTSGRLSVRNGQIVWANTAGASGSISEEGTGSERVLKGTVAQSSVTFELRLARAAVSETGSRQSAPAAGAAPSPACPTLTIAIDGMDMNFWPSFIGSQAPRRTLTDVMNPAITPPGELARELEEQQLPGCIRPLLWSRNPSKTTEAVDQLKMELVLAVRQRGAGSVNVIAHSWGGVIAYIALSDEWLKSYPDARVRNLITLGTPVGSLAERVVITTSDTAVSTPESVITINADRLPFHITAARIQSLVPEKYRGQPLIQPWNVDSWVNFYSLSDSTYPAPVPLSAVTNELVGGNHDEYLKQPEVIDDIRGAIGKAYQDAITHVPTAGR